MIILTRQKGERADLEVRENKKQILSVKDVQNILGCSKNKAYSIVGAQGFPKIKIGKQFYIPEEEFQKWIRKYTYNQFNT